MANLNIGLFSQQSSEDKILFSMNSLQYVADGITMKLKGVHPDGKDITPLYANIIEELKFLQSRNTYLRFNVKSEEEKYIQIRKQINAEPTLIMMLDECIDRMSTDIKSQYDMERFRSSTNIWNTNMESRTVASDGGKSHYLNDNNMTPQLSFRMSM